jgi:uncharacterized protein YdaU (DUF1376 family)
MHYFKKNIGDYAKKTGRLTMLQHGAYTLLIDSCYDREKFPTLAEAIEWTWASTKEEVEAVQFVLTRFFDEVDGVYIQKRIQEEIDEYHAKSTINKRIAQERESKRKQTLTKRTRSVDDAFDLSNEAPPNHKPITNNHKPINTTPPDGVSQSVWDDFVLQRKEKKASITETAIQGIEREAKKANMTLNDALQEICARGWVGFKAKWVLDQQQTIPTDFWKDR